MKLKKSLVIVSFAFIFLLSLSIVSAGFFDWMNGDITSRQTSAGDKLPTSISKTNGKDGTFSRTSEVSTTSPQRSSSNTANRGPGRGWEKTTDINGEDCWYKSAKKRSLFTR